MLTNKLTDQLLNVNGSTKLRFVCLANSYKEGGRCIAGKIIGAKNWIRPVSNNIHGQIDAQICCNIKLLDIIEMEFSKHMPIDGQPENVLFVQSLGGIGEINGKMNYQELLSYADEPTGLWDMCDRNARISATSLELTKSSLYLIRVRNLEIHVSNEFGKMTVRANFRFINKNYRLKVTDPIAKQHFINIARSNYFGCIFTEEAMLCISLGVEFHGYCYKLVAGIITDQGYRYKEIVINPL